MGKPVRILALTKYGPQAASTRQRLLQFAPYLADHGIEIEARPLLDDGYVRALAKGERFSRRRVLASYARRLAILASANRYDLIWVHFEAFPYAPAFLERLLGFVGRPVVVDFDDAIFHMYDRHSSSLVRSLLGRKLQPLLRLATAVTVGNSYLESYVGKFNRDVTVIPTVVDTERYTPKRKELIGQPLVIGWIGSPSTWPYVERVLPYILPRVNEAGAVFRAVGAGPAAMKWDLVEAREWSEEGEIDEVRQMDIGIMPLPEEDWAKGKCGYKLIQYMACGLPTIASPVGVNTKIVAHGETGFLASDAKAWCDALDRLLGDRELRAKMGARGREVAVNRYSLQSQEPRLLDTLSRALGRGVHR